MTIYSRMLMAAAVVAGSLALTLAKPPAARAEAPTIRLGQVSLSFYAVVGGIVQEVLDEDGYKVDVTAGSHGDIFPKLGAGDVDILVAAWLPDGHAPLYAKVKDDTFVIGELYDNAKLYWAVPDYVPADLVRTIDDLKKPEVTARMDKRIRGIGATSAGVMGGSSVALANPHVGTALEMKSSVGESDPAASLRIGSSSPPLRSLATMRKRSPGIAFWFGFWRRILSELAPYILVLLAGTVAVLVLFDVGR